MKLLEVDEIHSFYGLSHILFGVSLFINIGETTCLMGRNGVGKTTTLKSIMGLIHPRSGSIKFKDKLITGKPTFVVARQGISYVPEDRQIFANLTVGQNLEIAHRKGANDDGSEWTLNAIYDLFPILRERRSQFGGTLSGGEQQMLAIARALRSNSQLMLLDEPFQGLSPLMMETTAKQILRLKEAGISILLSECSAKFSLKVSERVYIMEKGKICYEGSSKGLEENPQIITKYLGI